MSFETYREANRKLWNTRTHLHVDSAFYDVAGFKAGGTSLTGIELDELGPIEGKSILHLQCHFGLDTLSLARLGANMTGVDLSDASIDYAIELAQEVNLPATFVNADVLELPELLDGRFDIVFSSFGAVGWLPDLNRWANVIKHFLKPGGFFYYLEFHRQFVQMNEEGEIAYNYFYSETPDEETMTQTYADAAPHPPMQEYWWNHTTSDIVMALIRSGLSLADFREFAYCSYKLNDSMVESSPGKWVHERHAQRIPYMFSMRAENR